MISNYKLEGTPNSPVLLFSNSLGATLEMWDDLVPLLLPYFRVLRYDTRGHGGSLVTPEPYTIAQLGSDVIELLDHLEIDRVHFCGLSMGGLIGQWLGIHHPERINKLILSNTDSKIGTAQSWNERITLIRTAGMEVLVEATVLRWFTDNFIQNHPQRVDEIKKIFLANDVTGYSNCCAAIGNADLTPRLKEIVAETLIITGEEDEVTNVAAAEQMVAAIPNAQMAVLPARHLASTELPEAYTELLLDFLVGESTFNRGMHVRRTVLGNPHVDNAQNKRNAFNSDFQDFISEYAWGAVWTRPGLSKHQRSLITLAMLIPLNRSAEFKMHVKAAFNNGVTVSEIKEIILQSGIYCGLPAANEAMHKAEEVFTELGI